MSSEGVFIAGSNGIELLSERDWERFIGLSPYMSLATDILFEAGMMDGQRLRLLQAAEASGRNPAEFARHLVRLSAAVR